MTRSASVLQLDRNRRHQNRDTRSRPRPGPSRSGLEEHLLATMVSAAALMEAAADVQKQTAAALRALAVPGGDEDAAPSFGQVEDAIEQLGRVEHALQVLTSPPGGRLDWSNHRDRRLRSAGASGPLTWPAEPLTAREAAVLRLLCGTLPLREIGGELGVSRNTIKSQVQAIYRKLGVCRRLDAVDRARQVGLLLSAQVLRQQ